MGRMSCAQHTPAKLTDKSVKMTTCNALAAVIVAQELQDADEE